MEQIPHIKKDAIMEISISAGFLVELKNILLYIYQGKTKDELEILKKKVQEGVETTGWMRHAINMSSLIHGLETKAKETNQLEYKPIKETSQSE